ncbi:tight adherence protein C [Acetoanaerobium pronyense]|uniref:Tight adherence protein C n=1 Tax=Acetoanaerobium pronyense TaxID=1482736 RepID=A0ABS4KKJ1_9FIRM|nr:type II secretion system F family protein [Acetoanaerobium pronyense]MBP2028297.1 tight adherence protein C [Acetoanaerobium pronyense]
MDWTMIIAFIGISHFIYLGIATVLRPVTNIKERIKQIEDIYSDQGAIVLDERRKPFGERVIRPFTSKVSKEIYKRTPKGRSKEIERKLEIAGHPYGLSLSGWIIASSIVTWVLPIVFIMIISIGPYTNFMKVLYSVLFFGFCFIFPNFVLNQKIRERKFVLSRQLPDILDLMTVSVESGLSFDSAMAKVAEKGSNELSKEFGKVVYEIQMGISRRQALKNMVQRCDTDDVRVFLSSVIQAEQLGVSIGKVLRVQSAQMRTKRRQRAEELAMKAPIKMIIPIVFFIFPSMFVVILGPALIQIKNMLIGL